MKKCILLSMFVFLFLSGCVDAVPPLPILHGKELRAILPYRHYKPRFHTQFSVSYKLKKHKKKP